MQLPQFVVSAGKLRQAWMVHLERNTTSPGTGPTQIRQEFPEPFLIVLVQQHAVRFRPPDNLGETLFGDRFEDRREHQLVLAKERARRTTSASAIPRPIANCQSSPS